jgi:hypothetical protein
MIARSVDLRSIMQKGSWCFGAWDLCHPNMSKLSHRAERRTLKKKKRTTITGRDVLNRSQKRRVQRLYSLEEAKAKYLEMLRKACPDLVDKVHHTQKRESRPPKKQWCPKPTRADVKTSADAHMVYGVLRPKP